MYGLTDERYRELHNYGNEDCTIESLIRFYGLDVVQKGYIQCRKYHYESGTSIIPNALHIEHVAQLAVFNSDWDACRQAERDGVNFINDMDGLEKGFYIDTPENRKICSDMLQKYPERRVEHWLDVNDGEWGSRYAEFFSDSKKSPIEEINTISINDVLHTLRECDRNGRYDGMFEHMLTFASELTGISEDVLVERMYQGTTFLLSRDTDLGSDLMALISDNREDFDYSCDDIDKIRTNNCFGHIMLSVQEYLDTDEIDFDGISFGRYSSDRSARNLMYVVDRAFHEYLDGAYNIHNINTFIDNARAIQAKNFEKTILAPDFSFDFGTGYQLQTVFANKTAEGMYGDIYVSRSEAVRKHPNSEIISGYCVVSVATGLVADGCNDWNNTIPDAIKDYEEHVAPIPEQNEDIELNYTEVDSNSNPIRETLYSVKSRWLQNYFGVDNQCQLEAFLTNSEEWDPAEILNDARKEPSLSGLVVGDITEFSQNNVPADLVPYRIKITESYVKEVVIYEKSGDTAEEMADYLCAEGEIDVDVDNFVDRSIECLGIARQSDLGCHDVFGLDEPVSSAPKPSLANVISSAEQIAHATGTKTKQIEPTR